ncbi:MAG: hypothetical protein ACN6QT_26920 [Burkholderia contaminans]|uniref:Uncharacterized protein n=1 Tax=Burkholderia contaminans TaxID=488447 RepID=A0AAP4RB39_9BURK|nr:MULTISPECIES: hypothetical protein [Burkholderia]MCA7879629.1 hypothetical protein [Burkholderia contaminans]MDN7570290.1 hypothetical protein [Burkholderia contaminans]MDN8026661.1 hypothetical protein [Burkholderia contaminans]UXZ67303.1 hypothetical protein NUJ29_00970 [Burkholderia contaminans]UXZ75064.1 hypothetical protein NUJ30_00960 [Burkholderia contaminans]
MKRVFDFFHRYSQMVIRQDNFGVHKVSELLLVLHINGCFAPEPDWLAQNHSGTQNLLELQAQRRGHAFSQEVPHPLENVKVSIG